MSKVLKIVNLTLVFAVCVFLVTGCSGQSKVIKQEKQAKADESLGLVPEITPTFEYKIGDFDELEIRVWEGASKPTERKEGEDSTEYRIAKGDTLNISVWQWEDLNKDVIVRPDGRLSFPLVGELVVDGMTLTELGKIMTEKLKAYIKYPEVSIMVKEFGKSKFGALKDLPQQVGVRPDGRISYPFIGDVFVRGKTLNEVNLELTKKLSNYFSSPAVYINLAKIGGKRIIVLGEVDNPGVYKTQENARILDAVAFAGGYTKDAALASVMLVRGGLDKPKAQKINVAKIMKGDLTHNVLIEPEDIIYVPKTAISNFNYILTLLLSSLQSSGTATGNIRSIRARTNPFTTTTTIIPF